MKVARRIAVIALATLAIVAVDRTGWPLFTLVAVWVTTLVLLSLVAERRGYPKPLTDFSIFGLVGATALGLTLQMSQLLLDQHFAGAAVFAIFILILVKAALDFLERPLPGEKKTSVVLTTVGKPLAEPRHEVI